MSQPPPIPTVPPPPRRSPASLPAALCTIAGLAISMDVLFHGRLYQMDTLLARRIYTLMMRSPQAISFCSSLSRLGDWPFTLAVGVIVAIVLLVLNRGRLLTLWALGLLGSLGLNLAMKTQFAEPRPTLFSQFPLDNGFTYPSGHIMGTVMIFGLIAYLLTHEAPRFKWLWTLLALLIILTVAAALLLLGVHYLTDILGGLTMAAGWLFLVIALVGEKKPAAGQTPALQADPTPK